MIQNFITQAANILMVVVFCGFTFVGIMTISLVIFSLIKGEKIVIDLKRATLYDDEQEKER